MSKILWKSLLVSPAILGAALAVSTSAAAAEVQVNTEASQLQVSEAQDFVAAQDLVVEPSVQIGAAQIDTAPVVTAAPTQVAQAITSEAPVAQAAPEAPVAQAAPEFAPAASTSVDSLEQINRYSAEGNSNAIAQVTSVSQLSDVQPTDWAFQALQSLVERYGCIAGYPDGTYRGNRALTRYEFAAGLNACLDRVNELIASALGEGVTAEDLATLQRLQEEFAAELATLRGRVDALEARTAELEANQFSTTTKLNGEVIFALADAFDQDDEIYGRDTDNTIFGYRARLNFDTSFTGSDRLRTRFQARNMQDFASADSPAAEFSFSGFSGERDSFQLDDLFYSFQLSDRVGILIGANSLDADDFVASTISPFDSSGQGSLSNFGFPPQYYFGGGDAGIGGSLQLTNNVSLDFGYTSGTARDPGEDQGVFNGDYAAIGQLTFLSDPLDAALTYIHSYAGDGFINAFDPLPTFIADDDGTILPVPGTNDVPEVANTYGAQVNFKLGGTLEIGGGIAYTPIRSIGRGDSRAISYQGTLAFRDFGGEGNLLGFLVGVPPRVTEIRANGQRVPDSAEDASLLVEGFYRYRLTDNISITPGVIWLMDPGNNNDAGDTVIGALRTTFSF